MSYDIYFWRELPEAKIDAVQLLRKLRDTLHFPGVVGVPLAAIRHEFQQEFPEITGGAGSLSWEGEGSYFQVGFRFLDERTAELIAVVCGYELVRKSSAMRRLEKVAAALGCRVYDPQQSGGKTKRPG